jgi:transcription initiation factor TFIIB
MTDFEELVLECGSELAMGQETSAEALMILKRADDKHLLAGKKPRACVAAALYIAGILRDKRRTLGQIAEVAKVSESTITNRYKELVRELDIKRR